MTVSAVRHLDIGPPAFLRSRALRRGMTIAVLASIGLATPAMTQANSQEYRFADLRWGASETYVKNRLAAQQFRQVAPDANGNPMWAGELLGLPVTVRPILYDDQLLGIIVDVFPTETMTFVATADSVRRILVRNYGEPRIEAPGVLSWGSGRLCFELVSGRAVELLYRSPNEDTSGFCVSKHF